MASAKPAGTTCLHVFYTRAEHESRFIRQADAARRQGGMDRVLLAARAHPGLPAVEVIGDGIEVHRLGPAAGDPRPSRLRHGLAVAAWIRDLRRFGRQVRPDLIQAHSLYGLAAAAGLARRLGVPLVYDAHELETERNGLHGSRKWVEKRLEARLIGACDAVLCVSDSIADWYADAYGIARPTVVRNVPDAAGQLPADGPSRLRARLGIDPQSIVFLYQGALFRGRRIEQVLRAFEGVAGGRHLVFMGYGELEATVRAAAAQQGNIHFLPAVPPREVLGYTAGADVGICGVENVCLSYFYALPNKLFEYLHAGIPTLVPPYPEMARVVAEHGCGWVVPDETAAWHEAFAGLDRATIEAGRSRVPATCGAFPWSGEVERLLGTYRAVLRG